MLPASAIAPPTLQAYLETDYCVHGEPGFTLRVGLASAELLAAHKRRRTGCSAFLTACNPFSQPLDAAAKALGTRLEQNGLVWSGADAVPQLILLR